MKQFMIVLMVMGFASAALAQGPGGRGTGGIMGLVSIAEVQKELSMTEAQVAKFTAIPDRTSEFPKRDSGRARQIHGRCPRTS